VLVVDLVFDMIERRDYTRTKWNGWGSASKSFALSERPGLEGFLSRKLGLYYFNQIPGVALSEVALAPTRLTDGARRDLAVILGEQNIREDHETRVTHSVGKSYQELVKVRQGEVSSAPDAVIFPGGAREVREILSWASLNSAAVIPFGGGTGAIGGVEPCTGPSQQLALSLDLRRMDRILFVDEKSQVAKIEPGIRGPMLEESLQAQGLTLGHYPQSFEYSTLGGWLATRSAGLYSSRYGRIEDLAIGLSVETPAGSIDIRGVPARATGPELREILVGSEGCLGVICLAEMRLHRKPAAQRILAFLLRDFETGASVARELVQQDVPLAMVRLSDEEDTELVAALDQRATGLAHYLRRGLDRLITQRYGLSRPCLLLLGLQGSERRVEADIRSVSRFMQAYDAYDLGDDPGQAFRRDRFLFPYLRDSLMDLGLLADTLETAVSWAGLHRLHSQTRQALSKVCAEFGASCVIGSQLTHAYRSGASLLFTLLAHASQGDELQLWRACKVAASETILRSGGTLSHHHGIGGLHREWMTQEHGPLGIALLRHVKDALDPAGILNPGKLLPD
jgi:alkyldihydroxyacetonephosphate synthase